MKTYTAHGILNLPVLTPAQASTLALLSLAGVTYCGRDGADAFAEGVEIDGAPVRYRVGTNGRAARTAAWRPAAARGSVPRLPTPASHRRASCAILRSHRAQCPRSAIRPASSSRARCG